LATKYIAQSKHFCNRNENGKDYRRENSQQRTSYINHHQGTVLSFEDVSDSSLHKSHIPIPDRFSFLS